MGNDMAAGRRRDGLPCDMEVIQIFAIMNKYAIMLNNYILVR
jgi:hypothetical protein